MKLITYRLLIPCVPHPFETTATALDLKSAVAKAKRQAKQCGLSVFRGTKAIEHEIVYVRTV